MTITGPVTVVEIRGEEIVYLQKCACKSQVTVTRRATKAPNIEYFERSRIWQETDCNSFKSLSSELLS